jgi:hypothetical protein
MWKIHVIYESRSRSVIVTLRGHLYRVTEVVPTTIPPKQCCNVLYHTAKFIFFTVCSKGEQKNTTTTAASVQAPFFQQKQVDKIEAKNKDYFCTQSTHIARLVKEFQPFQPQVRDNLQQDKQHNVSIKASNSSRCRFKKHFPPSPMHSTQ